MARMVIDNAFSLLNDEEGDDNVESSVQRIVKRVEEENKKNELLEKEKAMLEVDAKKKALLQAQMIDVDVEAEDDDDGFLVHKSKKRSGLKPLLDQYHRDRGRGRGRGRSRGRGRGRGRGGQGHGDRRGAYGYMPRINGEKKHGGHETQDNNASSKQFNVNEDMKFGGEDRECKNGDANEHDYERRGYRTNNRGRGRFEYQRIDKNREVSLHGNVGASAKIVDANLANGGSESDAVVVSEVSVDASSKGNKSSQKAKVNNGDASSRDSRRNLTKEEEEEKRKKKEEMEKDDGLMTLAQYEAILSENRKKLESLKTEERKVTIDKDLEGMQLVEKKQDYTFIKLNSEKNMKKKAEEEQNNNNGQQKEKNSKAVVANVAEFLKPASYRRPRRRGQYEQDGIDRRSNRNNSTIRSDHQYNHHPRDKNGDTRASFPAVAAQVSVPKMEDFPVLGCNASPST